MAWLPTLGVTNFSTLCVHGERMDPDNAVLRLIWRMR